MKNKIIIAICILFCCSCSNKSTSSELKVTKRTEISVCFPRGSQIIMSHDGGVDENVMNVPIDTTSDGKVDIVVKLRKQDLTGLPNLQEILLAHMFTANQEHCLGNAYLDRYNDGSIRLRYVPI